MVDNKLMADLDRDGFTVVPGVLAPAEITLLRAELEAAIAEDGIRYPGVFDKGMVHNCMVRGEQMAHITERNPALYRRFKP